MSKLRIDQLVSRIDASFGPELPFVGESLTTIEVDALGRVFGDEGYQEYLQDQVNRQIIRHYLTNAVLLGFVTEERLARYSGQAGSREGRALLSLHMLMSSVEEAGEIPLESDRSKLRPLRPVPGSPPHMEVVRN